MKTYDNNGRLVSDVNTSYTTDGKVINTNTVFNNGRPVSQNISIRDSHGKVDVTNIINGKLLP